MNAQVIISSAYRPLFVASTDLDFWGRRLNWEDERYVRLYTHDTVTWKLIGWQGRCLLPLLLRKVDRAGCLDMQGAGADGVSALIDVPLEVVEPGLAALQARGIVEIKDDVLIFPKFLMAQEAKQSDRRRQIESRERRRASALNGPKQETNNGSPCDVTLCDAASHNVTERHTASLDVTPCSAVLSSAVLSSEKNSSARVAESVPFNALSCWAALAVRAGSKLRLAKDSGHETGLAEPHLSNFVRSAIGLSKRDPPFVLAAYEALGDWIAAGGLDWHAQHNTPPWKRVCERLEDCLSAAAEWDRGGRPEPGKKPERAGWKPDPSIGSDKTNYGEETDKWLSRQG